MRRILVLLLTGLWLTPTTLPAGPLHDALRYISRGDLDRAAALLDRIADPATPQGAEALILRGRALFLAKRYAEAESAYARAARSLPKDSPLSRKARFGLAECHAARKRFDQAEALFSEVLGELTSAERREQIARRYVLLGDEHLDPAEDKASADPARAERFFRAALEVGIEGKLAEEVEVKLGRCLIEQNRFAEAAQHFEHFLDSREDRLHRAEATFLAGQASHKANQPARARRHLREVLAAYPRSAYGPKAAFLLSRTHGMPQPQDAVSLLRGQEALRRYIQLYPGDRHVQKARLEMSTAAMHLKRYADAEDELRDYLEKGGPEANLALVRFNLGACLAAQARFDEAVQAWRSYLKQHTSHGNWLQARQGIENMAWRKAETARSNQAWSEAARLYSAFADAYPAATRTPQALLRAGESWAELGEADKALNVLRTLTGKFPKSGWAGQGWYRTGLLLEERRGDIPGARKAYKKASEIGGEGSATHLASARLQALDEASLIVEAPRTFRSGEKVSIRWQVRNIESVHVRQFRIEAEDFFRDRLGMQDVTGMDIALCAPDRTWDEPVRGYQKHKRVEQEVPLDIRRPGLYLLNLTAKDLEATTALLVTDLGIIFKTAPGEVFVFVQNLKKLDAMPGARVLVANEKKILFEGRTGPDGVARTKLPEDEDVGELRAFVSRGDDLGWTELENPGGQPETAATPRAFLFSDRPVYRPGDEVGLAGIVRDHWNEKGYLTFVAEEGYELSVYAPGGRIVLKEPVRLDEFGVFHHRLRLDPATSPGGYSFRLAGRRGTFSGSFRVESFRPRPFDVAIDFDKPVVFQGEMLTGTIRLRNHHGSPVADQAVGYRLGRDQDWKAGTSDESGQVRFAFPTRGFEETSKITLHVRLPRHNLVHQADTLIAVQGFEVRLELDQKTLFAGQPFDVTLRVSGPDNRPRGAQVELHALRRLGDSGGEVRVHRKKLRIPEDGSLRTSLTLEKGGMHILRVFGHDRARHPVTAELAIHLVGEDQPGIYLDVDRSVQTLGTPLGAQIHSRLDRALVLLTYETDRILGHRTLIVNKGINRLQVPLTEELAPNFVLAASVMADDKFDTAARAIQVGRKMSLVVRPDRQDYAPGDEVSLTLIARDAAGRPVDARLILSVVDEALLRQFPENLPELLPTFHRERPTGLVFTTSSNTFRFPEVTAELVERAEVHEAEGSAGMAALRERRKVLTEKAAERFAELSGAELRGMGHGGAGSAYGVGGLGLAGRGAGGGGAAIRMGKASVMGGAPLRQFFQETAAFLPEVRTGPDGVAHVTFRLPDAITTWRITARGVTRDTQLGEERTHLTASRAFWARLVLPAELEEEDRVQPVVRVFNDSRNSLDVRLKLSSGPAGSPVERTVQVPPEGTAPVTFPVVPVPEGLKDGKMDFLLSAVAGDSADRVKKSVPVRPRGVRERRIASGVLRDSASRTLVLDRALSDPQLHIQVDARMTHLFFAGRLDDLLFGDRPEAALVALNLLDLLGPKAEPTMRDLVRSRLKRSLDHLMNVQRHDGGWGWSRGCPHSSALLTAAAVRALARARPIAGTLGWVFPQAEFDRAVTVLKDGLTHLPPEDWMRRTVALHALAHLGEEHVPVVHLHRLHRLRRNLPLGAQATLGLTWILLGRPEKASEVVEVLRPNIQLDAPGPRTPAWLITWGRQPADLALALALLAEVRPADPLVKRGGQWLLERGEGLGFFFPRETEAVSLALSKILRAAKREERFRVRAFVNGREAGGVDVLGGKIASLGTIRVDPALLKPGDNRLELKLEGAGQCFFLATLSGYRRDAPAEKDDPPVKLTRLIEPVPRAYRGQDIQPGFTVVEPGGDSWVNAIERIPAARRVRVTLLVEKEFPEAVDHCVLEDRIPPGFELVPGSLHGQHTHVRTEGRRLAAFMSLTGYAARIHYELAAVNPGTYHFPPAVLQSLANPDTRALGGASVFVIDEPGAPEKEVRPTPDELYRVGLAASEKEPALAVQKLEELSGNHQLRDNIAQEVLGKLLFASIDLSDLERIVKYFELAKEKNPALVVPFDKIGPVQEAYRSLKLHEAGLHLDRGLAKARFMAEVRAVGVLESENEMAEALALLKDLVRTFPDNRLCGEAAYAFSQVIFARADAVAQGEEVEGFDRPGLLDEVIGLMTHFLGRFPADPQGPPAVYSLASALLERDKAREAVQWCDAGLKRYADADLAPAITYLKAYSHFKVGEYAESLQLCKQVDAEESDEDNREMARYIMAQIHHARGAMDEALRYYRLVQDRFRDARETVDESRKVVLSVPDVLEVRRGERPVLEMTVRNLERIDLRAYRVDPMKLYLLKGSLENLGEINLAGIRPVFSRVHRPRRRPGVTQEEKIPLRLPGQGAYLLLVRGGSRLRHSLVLAGSLQTEVSEDVDEGRVRVTVRDDRGRAVPGARVQLKGTENDRFTAGHTDLRGIFIAEDIAGAVTVLAQHKKAYGLYRGTQELTAAEPDEDPDEVIYRKRTVVDFDDDVVEGELLHAPKRQEASDFFNQDVKGMSVEQAK